MERGEKRNSRRKKNESGPLGIAQLLFLTPNYIADLMRWGDKVPLYIIPEMMMATIMAGDCPNSQDHA